MKLKFIVFLITLMALPTITFAKTIELKIKGVGLNSTYSAVIKNLGKPVSKRTHEESEDSCAPGKYIFLKYNGLEIELIEGDKKGVFIVTSIQIKSAKWLINNGITIGASESQIVKAFGKPFKTETESGEKFVVFLHKGEEASATFVFRKDKLVRMYWAEFLC